MRWPVGCRPALYSANSHSIPNLLPALDPSVRSARHARLSAQIRQSGFGCNKRYPLFRFRTRSTQPVALKGCSWPNVSEIIEQVCPEICTLENAVISIEMGPAHAPKHSHSHPAAVSTHHGIATPTWRNSNPEFQIQRWFLGF